MNAGAAGFAGAPVTKFLLATSVSSSVIVQAAHGFHRRPPAYLHFFTQSFVFRHPGELACGTLLLYYFRLFERQRGSAKHGACAASTVVISYALQTAVSAALSTVLPAGPYGWIFANFIPFTLDVPPAQRFTLFGMPMTDKARIPQSCCHAVPVCCMLNSDAAASLLYKMCRIVSRVRWSHMLVSASFATLSSGTRDLAQRDKAVQCLFMSCILHYFCLLQCMLDS